jgi:predicted amidohydrolase YtcJ
VQHPPRRQPLVELVNGRIVDAVNGRFLDEGTSIILQGNKIASMPGSAGEPRVAVDFTIDLKGKTVLSGLFNSHVHLTGIGATMVPGPRDMLLAKIYNKKQLVEDLDQCLERGVTNIRDAAFVADLRAHRKLKEQILYGPRIQQSVVVGPTGSYMQEKLPAWMKVSGMPVVDPSKDHAGAVAFPINASEAQVRDAVDIAIDERGAEAIKIGEESPSLFSGKPLPVMSMEQLTSLADQARRRGVPSTMHHMTVESFRRGVRAGVSSLAHFPWDAPLTEQDVEAFMAAGCLNDPTISAFYAIFSWRFGEARSSEEPELDRLTAFRDKTYPFSRIADEFYIPELRSSVMNGYKKCASGNPKTMGLVDMSGMYAWSAKTATGFENFRLLYKHGVPMTTGNDNKPPCTLAMVELELRMMDHVLQGDADGVRLTGADAVKIATINSARSLGLAEEFGSIEIGKTADLVILDGNPLQDFRLIGSRVAALFMAGWLAIDNCDLEVVSHGTADDCLEWSLYNESKRLEWSPAETPEFIII